MKAIVVLGGGREKRDGYLTILSKNRLQVAADNYRSRDVDNLIVMGGRYKSYEKEKGLYNANGADLRATYLHDELGIATDTIIKIGDEECRDTIYEAFATRKLIREKGYTTVYIATSERHKRRALMIFQRVFGEDIHVELCANLCSDDLNDAQEGELYRLTEKLFTSPFFRVEDDPKSWDEWYKEHIDFYREQHAMHERYAIQGYEFDAYRSIHAKEFH